MWNTNTKTGPLDLMLCDESTEHASSKVLSENSYVAYPLFSMKCLGFKKK